MATVIPSTIGGAVIGEAVRVKHPSSATIAPVPDQAAKILLHIVDLGGNSRGSFEFDSMAQVSQVKDKLGLKEDQRADLVFQDLILQDSFSLEESGVPTGTTLTVVIMPRIIPLSERVKVLLDREARKPQEQRELEERPPPNAENRPAKFDRLLFILAVVPLLNDVMNAFMIWDWIIWESVGTTAGKDVVPLIDIYVIPILNALVSTAGISRLVHLHWQTHNVPGGCDCCCTCACLPWSQVVWGIWHLSWLVRLMQMWSSPESPLRHEAWVGIIVPKMMTTVSFLVLGWYWCKLMRRHHRSVCCY